jgi:teichuronic acid biosynthesis glycosyltransferase TuaC
MRILYLAANYPDFKDPSKGPTTYYRVIELLKKNIDVGVCKLNSVFERNRFIRLMRDYNLKDLGFDEDVETKVINCLRIPRINIFVFAANRVRDYFIKGKYNLINAHFVSAGYPAYVLRKKYGIPYVVTTHGSDIHTHPLKNRITKKITVEILECANRVIFVSEYLLEEAKRLGYNPSNAVVVPNGIHERYLCLQDEEKLEKSSKVIGFVGNLVPIKRADRLAEIFFKINQVYPNSEFIVIGDGILRSNIERKLCSLKIDNRVSFTGRIHPYDVPIKISEMDVLVLPSRREGFGKVAVEAQARGVPVVASNNGGIPEAVGNGGYIVDEGPDFEERFARAVVKMLDNPIDRDSLKARAQEYTWEKIVQREIEVYKEVLEIES